MKKLYYLIILVAVFFFNLVCIKADLPSSLDPIGQYGAELFDNKGFGMYLKKTKGNSSVVVICTDYYKTTPAESGISCTKTDEWSEEIRYGVAEIINLAEDCELYQKSLMEDDISDIDSMCNMII